MSSFEFESRSAEAPAALVWGFAKVDALRATPARVHCYVEGDDVAGVSFVGAGGEPAANGSAVHIRMYRLPGADAAFADELKSIQSIEKPWPLPGARAFEQTMLAPANVPADWRHKAVQIFSSTRGTRGIAHAYRGRSRAMIVCYEQRRGDVIDDALFVWAGKNIGVIEAAWLLDPPVA